MKYLLNSVLLIFSLIISMNTHAEVTQIEDAVEAAEVRIYIDDRLQGSVSGKNCPSCKTQRLKINKHTQAIRKGIRVHLSKARETNGKGAVIIYSIKTRTATKIMW